MNEIFIYSALAVFLLGVHSFLVVCEVCLVHLRYRMVGDFPAIKETRAVKYLIKNGQTVAHVIRLGLVSCNIMGGLVSFLLIEVLLNFFGLNVGGWEKFLFFCLLCPFVISFWFLVCDRIPRSLALLSPDKALNGVADGVSVFVILFSPLVSATNYVGKTLLKWGKQRYSQDFNLLDAEVQIRALGADETSLSGFIQLIVKNGLRMNELEVSDVMLPRNQVQCFDISDSFEVNILKARTTGHTRFPLCDGDLDNCLGIVHIKDIFRFNGDLKDLDVKSIRRKIVSISSDESLESALKLLLDSKQHMGIVLDEFGGAEGVITLENIFEQLVGQINDEFDTFEEDNVSLLSHSNFKVDGLTPIHDLEEKLGIEVDNDEVSTFGGLITAELGRFPENAEQIIIEEAGLSVTIDEVDEKRIISATVRVLPQPDGLDDESNG